MLTYPDEITVDYADFSNVLQSVNKKINFIVLTIYFMNCDKFVITHLL